jgi:hypothetical protein
MLPRNQSPPKGSVRMSDPTRDGQKTCTRAGPLKARATAGLQLELRELRSSQPEHIEVWMQQAELLVIQPSPPWVALRRRPRWAWLEPPHRLTGASQVTLRSRSGCNRETVRLAELWGVGPYPSWVALRRRLRRAVLDSPHRLTGTPQVTLRSRSGCDRKPASQDSNTSTESRVGQYGYDITRTETTQKRRKRHLARRAPDPAERVPPGTSIQNECIGASTICDRGTHICDPRPGADGASGTRRGTGRPKERSSAELHGPRTAASLERRAGRTARGMEHRTESGRRDRCDRTAGRWNDGGPLPSPPRCPRPMSAGSIRALAKPDAKYLRRMRPVQDPDPGNAMMGGLPPEFCALCTTARLIELARTGPCAEAQPREHDRWIAEASDCIPTPSTLCHCFLQGGVQICSIIAAAQCAAMDRKTLEVDFRPMVRSDRMWKAATSRLTLHTAMGFPMQVAWSGIPRPYGSDADLERAAGGSWQHVVDLDVLARDAPGPRGTHLSEGPGPGLQLAARLRNTKPDAPPQKDRSACPEMVAILEKLKGEDAGLPILGVQHQMDIPAPAAPACDTNSGP